MAVGWIWSAVVLAADRRSGDRLAEALGVRHKALLPVAGIPMLERVLAALERSSGLARVAVVIGEEDILQSLPTARKLDDAGRLVRVAADSPPSRSVARALSALGSFPVLVTTADHPLLTPELIETFLARSEALDADLVVGVAAEAVVARAFPESRRTYWRFRDGGFSGANLFALRRPEAIAVVDFWRRVEEERKRPWRIARAFGLVSLLLYLAGRLTLAEAMRRASRAIGATVEALPLAVAEAAVDVDKLEDLELVERIFAARRAA
jgi:CTP:molybdopterin cytidylyltransferase MocA